MDFLAVPITLGTNIASLGAQRRLAATGDRIASVYERLSSGQRINRASDDAAGLAIATTLNSNTRVFNQAVRNVSDGVSALTIADSAIANLQDIVIRQTELAEQSANGVYSTAQRAALNTEAQALYQEYARITATTSFNGLNLLNGSISGIRLQAGYGNNGSVNADFFNVGAGAAGSTTDAGTTSNSTLNFDLSFSPHLYDTGFLFGDLNYDGRQDVVALYLGGDDLQFFGFTMQVFLGQASGGYAAADSSATNFYDQPGEVPASGTLTGVLVDVGSDGDLDVRIRASMIFDLSTILTENETFTNLTVQNGGTFTLDTAFNDGTGSATALSSGGSSIADLNGDGFADDVIDNADGTFTIRIHNTTTSSGSAGSIDDLTQASFSLTTEAGARLALTSLGTLSDEISTTRGKLGASLSRLSSANSVLQATTVNFAAAGSRIMSADIASESSDLTRNTILQQAATAVLAQANLQPSLALKLLAA